MLNSRQKDNYYLSSLDAANQDALLKLQHRMAEYYTNSPYHSEWIKDINTNWQNGVHDAQLAMCKIIPNNSSVLEVGCGDGSSAKEISSYVKNITYTGIDLSEDMWNGRKDFNFIAASADNLPFPSNSFDVVLSMFVIEHLVFPNRFLDEAWRVLKRGGILITIAPDFDKNAMPSERIGFSYGSGREKLLAGRFLDAILTAYDSQVRLPLVRFKRRKKITSGTFNFPIFIAPRCLKMEKFVPDCDAIYPVTTAEIENYIKNKQDYKSCFNFYKNSSTFGLTIEKI
jgi:SAM-dependent methyltransferase